MSVDVLKTVAILDASNYLAGAERMARSTAAVGEAAGFERIASGATLAGGLLTGLGAKAVSTAASFQQQQMAFEGLLGSASRGKQMFQQLAQFTVRTPFQLQDWTQATRTLLGWGVAAKDIMPSLQALGNSEAAMGRTGADLQKAAYELGEMGAGFLSMRQVRNLMMDGVPAAAALKKELHLTGEELANIGKAHIDGKVGVAAILKYVRESNLKGGMAEQMGTLNGSVTSLKDNWNLFLTQVGSPALQPLTRLVNGSSDLLSNFQKMPPEAQRTAGTAALIAGPLLLASGPLIRMIGLWKGMAAATRLAASASALERGAELAKMPVLESESAAVVTATGRWATFGRTLLGVATKAGTLAGALVALQGAADAYHAVTSKTGAADMEFDSAYQDYRRNRGAAVGDSLWHLSRTMGHAFSGGLGGAASFRKFAGAGWGIVSDSKSPEARAAYGRLLPRIENAERNWAKVPWSEVSAIAERLNTIVSGARDYKASGGATGVPPAGSARAGDDLVADYLKHPEKYRGAAAAKAKPAAGPREFAEASLDRAETMMKIAKLNFDADKGTAKAAGDSAQYNKYRKEALGLIDRNIGLLSRYADGIEHVKGKAAAWLTTEKKILGLKEKRAEFSRSGLKDGSGDAMDKTIAKIISSAGLSDAEITKRIGVNRRFFSSLGGKRPTAGTKPVPKLDLHVHLRLGDKEMGVIVEKAEEKFVRELAQALEGSGAMSLIRSH